MKYSKLENKLKLYISVENSWSYLYLGKKMLWYREDMLHITKDMKQKKHERILTKQAKKKHKT